MGNGDGFRIYKTIKEVIDLRANAHVVHSGKRKNFIDVAMHPLVEFYPLSLVEDVL